jgi:Flp pilus assembly protein TadD
MQGLIDFFTTNKDGITTALAVLGALGSILVVLWGAWKLLLERLWKGRLRVDVKVFEIIIDPNLLLPKLYATENDDNPLADHRITYQPRDPNRDLQTELKAALIRSRYLLITAPTGYGKTREAGALAQTLMLEGWRILRIKNTDWLDTPKMLPEELKGNRSRVLILLDDLNGLFSAGNRMQSPRAEQMPLFSQSSYHERLLQVLNTLEGMCTESEIRVIATARSEAEQWKLLGYDAKDKLWKRFERVEIPELHISAAVGLMADATKLADIKANPADFEAIAHQSDGTYRNILLNLRRLRAQNRALTKDDYNDTLDGSWREIYEHAIRKLPAVQYLYAAIDILRQTGISLYPFLVEPAALLVWGGNDIQKTLRKRHVRRAMHYLTQETKILRRINDELMPSDGQIEARNEAIDWRTYAEDLEKLLLQLTKTHKGKMIDSLFGFGTNAYYAGQFERAEILWRKELEIEPDDPVVWSILGVLLTKRGRYTEAEAAYEAAYRQASQKGLNDAPTQYLLANLLEKLGRFEEAEAAYRQAIEKDPSFTAAYSSLGNLLKKLERYADAELAYRLAIEKDPNDAAYYASQVNRAELLLRKNLEIKQDDPASWSSLGVVLSKQGRYPEAEAAFRQAIQKDPNDVKAYSNLGNLLSGDPERYAEAEAAYRQAIEKDPYDVKTYSDLGLFFSENFERYAEAEVAFRQAIEKDPYDTTVYSYLGILLNKMERYAEAEAAYRQAIEKDPNYATAYNSLTILLRRFKREAEALPLLEKLVLLTPDDLNPYLGIVSIKKILEQSIPPEYIHKAHELVSEDDWYNRACLESMTNGLDAAFEYLQRAAQLEEFDPTWAWDDPNLIWLRNDPRFEQIVGPKPA